MSKGYDIECLKNDLSHLEEEIKTFQNILLDLMERRIKLQALMEEAVKELEREKDNG